MGFCNPKRVLTAYMPTSNDIKINSHRIDIDIHTHFNINRIAIMNDTMNDKGRDRDSGNKNSHSNSNNKKSSRSDSNSNSNSSQQRREKNTATSKNGRTQTIATNTVTTARTTQFSINRDERTHAHTSPQTKHDKKRNKRAMQLVSMEKKAAEEDRYFRQCQREAAQKRADPDNSTFDSHKREIDLFGTQGAQGIHFDKYNDIKVEVKKGSASTSTTSNSSSTNELPLTKFAFDQLSLHASIRRNLTLMKYSTPTPIQRHAIPAALAGEDLMCCAQTGSGKTCAFLLPVCAQLVQKKPFVDIKAAAASPRCIVLAPTRELVIQIELEAQKICYQIFFLRPVAVYGGVSQRNQIRDLAFGADIVVATPGRLTDFVDRSLITLAQVVFLVLDEADRMLDMGFEPQIRRLVLQSGMTSKENRQTLLFSATFPPKIQTMAAEFLRTYTWIAVGRVGSTTDSITQVLIKASPDKRQKLRLVVDALQRGPNGRTLIFVQKKRTATWVKNLLCKGGPSDGDASERFAPIPAEDIHGDRTQSQREAALAAFRSGTCRVLVATDVAARGLDIGGVEHVINMDLPTAVDDFDSYVHRIGRTGRAGHTGLATSMFVPGEEVKVGNGKIANQLILQLREAKQEVPLWLEEECVCGGMKSTGIGMKSTISTDVRDRDRDSGKGGRSMSGRGRGGNFGGRTRNGRGRGGGREGSESRSGNGERDGGGRSSERGGSSRGVEGEQSNGRGGSSGRDGGGRSSGRGGSSRGARGGGRNGGRRISNVSENDS